jgi:hypothetical protein
MKTIRHIAIAAAIAVVGGLGTAGLAHADGYVGDSPCDSKDYGTQGHNDDRSDDGCDTTRYENRGYNGDSAPDSYNHGHVDKSKPLGQDLFDGV